MNINTEKKLIKEVTLSHETERKSFETKMKVRLTMIIHFDSVSVPDSIGSADRYLDPGQAGRNWPPKEEKLRKFMIGKSERPLYGV
jgi:hypothetical protein